MSNDCGATGRMHYVRPVLRMVRLDPEERLMTCGKVDDGNGLCLQDAKEEGRVS